MSSRDIAELVESRHDNVKLCIERLTAKGFISFTSMAETSHDGAGARPVTDKGQIWLEKKYRAMV
jgi:phage regulator Rha-like protein